MANHNIEIQPIKLGADRSIFGPENTSVGTLSLNSNVVSAPETQSFDNTRVTTPQQTTKTPEQFYKHAIAHDNALSAYNMVTFGLVPKKPES